MRQPGSKRLTGNFEGCNRSSQSAAAHTARPPSSAHRLNLVGIGAPATHSSIHATKRTVPDYGSGPRFTEGTANFLVNRRVNNQQQMRWSLRGADFLLQVCCASDMARSVPVSDRNFSPPMIHVRSGGCSLTPPTSRQSRPVPQPRREAYVTSRRSERPRRQSETLVEATEYHELMKRWFHGIVIGFSE
jgi:hypothetical protein